MAIQASEACLPRRLALPRWLPAPAALALLAAAILVVATLAGSQVPLSDWLGDTDDAVRVITVRELLGGAPWFDTTLPRIGAPDPLVSHWSRLIDLPLALLIGGLTPLLGSEMAELATRIAWPVALFTVLGLIVARDAHRQAGALAAAFAMFFIVTCAVALGQFRPGRIDHHNAQIVCAVGGLIYLARSLDDRRAGVVGGCLLGIGLAVGYEAIALVVPALGLMGAIALWRALGGAGTSGVSRAILAAAATLGLALIATVPPARWLDVHCDTLSLNLVAVAACGAIGLWGAIAVRVRPALRLGIAGAGLAAGAGFYAGLEPACLAGPFGQVNPALKAIWLDQVMETKSILWLGAAHLAPTLAIVAFLIAGTAAQVALWRRHRDVQSGLYAAFVVLAAVLGGWQIKLMPYAVWLAALPLAVWAARLRGTASLSPTVIRLAAAVLLSQAALDAAFGLLVSPFQRSQSSAAAELDSADPRRACFRSGNVRGLAALPSGLVAGDVDLGPYVVALSPHRVVAAPYHRLDRGILANHAILDGPIEQGQRMLAKLGVDYVALCADRSAGAGTDKPAPASLRQRLLSGVPPGFARELDVSTGGAIRVWKVFAR